MLRTRTGRRFALGLLAVAMLVLTACGGSSEPPKAATSSAPAPTDFLSVVIAEDGQITLQQQEFVTDQPALRLQLGITHHGGGEFTDSPLFNKLVTVVSVARTERTSPMQLGSVILQRIDHNLYGDKVDVLLPLGPTLCRSTARPRRPSSRSRPRPPSSYSQNSILTESLVSSGCEVPGIDPGAPLSP